MSISDLELTLRGMKDALTTALDDLDEIIAGFSGQAEATAPSAPQKKLPELAEVRALLAEISRSGKTAEVRMILEAHGCQKLSQVPQEEYEAVMKEARALV